MFGTLLASLAADATTSIPDLAGRLGTDARTVRVLLEQCQRLGYLESVEAAGDRFVANACAGCPVACPIRPESGGACATAPGRPTWWRLTERGERAGRGPEAPQRR